VSLERCLSLVLVIMMSAALPSGAEAAQLALTSGTISYKADSAEDNILEVMISADGMSYVFVETGPGVTLVNVANRCPNHECPAANVHEIDIDLGDHDDHLVIGNLASALGPPPGTLRTVGAAGGAGRDSLKGGPAAETLDGGPGNDAPFEDGDGLHWFGLDGGGGDDKLVGGAGDDLLQGGEGDDGLDFGAVDDTLGSDTLDGGPGDDQLNGGAAGDAQDSDDLKGGAGTDMADFSERTASLTIDLDNGGDDGQAGEHDNVEADVENLLGGSDSDTLTGSGAANFIDGRNGDDRISGKGGDDVLDGGANSPGSDSLSGGAGGDTLSGRAGDDGLDGGDGDDSLSGAGGTDTLDGDDGNDSLAGGAGGDSLDGGVGDDKLNGAEPDLTGADGADDLAGGPGADVLLGVDGNDELDGGSGSDQMSGGDGRDTVNYESRSHAVTVRLDGLPNDGEENEGDNVGRDVEIVLGGTEGDMLLGDGDANRLGGGPGEDLVTGNAGRDILEGGNAPDLIQARDGDSDRVDCGDDGDLAIVDRRDTVRDCKWVDRGGKRRLVVGDSALVRPSQVPFGLRLPNGHRYFQLDDSLKFPVGSTIDARDAAVRLATARNRNGARQEMSILGGPFSVRQEAGKRPTTDLRLVGKPRGCARSASGPRAPADARVPKLDMRTDGGKRGKYRVRGRHSIGAPTGTSWVTEERCDGTFTRVRSGTVKVRDLERKRTVVLHPGDTYLARQR
jgi:Ca2+-binding RTX toxin-like protein